MHDATRSTSTPPVDNTDWLKTAAIIFVSIDHFGYFFVEDDRWWSLRTSCGSAVLLPDGLRANPDRPAPLDLARRHPDCARQLEC